jgi:hypothetical protein
LLIGDSVDKVREGTTLVEQAGLTMEEVVESVRRHTGSRIADAEHRLMFKPQKLSFLRRHT